MGPLDPAALLPSRLGTIPLPANRARIASRSPGRRLSLPPPPLNRVPTSSSHPDLSACWAMDGENGARLHNYSSHCARQFLTGAVVPPPPRSYHPQPPHEEVTVFSSLDSSSLSTAGRAIWVCCHRGDGSARS